MKEQGSKSRIDRIVENAGTELASKSTRRGFLGKVAGVTTATLFGGAVILGEKQAANATPAQAGCFSEYDTQVCYHTYRIVNPCWLNKGPIDNSPRVYGTSSALPYYNQPILMNPGDYFAHQASRTTPASGCNPPDSRPPYYGPDGVVWLWGYNRSTSKYGWAPWYGYAAPYTGLVWMEWLQGTGPASCGPAGQDFDCRNNGQSVAQKRATCPSYDGCTGSTLNDVIDSGAYWDIRNDGSDLANSNQKFYLRYNRNGVCTGWLMPGDKIKRLSYTSNGWSCIYCYCCAYLPYGCRGWVDSTALGTPGTYNSCGGSGQCPGGSLYP